MRPGTLGATVQSFAPANPRETLLTIMDQNPKVPRESLLSLVSDALQEPENLAQLLTVIEYWFINTLRSIEVLEQQVPGAKSVVREITKRATARAAGHVKTVILEEAKIELLKMAMPNGKTLGECTGKECQRFGGWLYQVGQRAGSRKVGQVMTEASLRELYAEAPAAT